MALRSPAYAHAATAPMMMPGVPPRGLGSAVIRAPPGLEHLAPRYPPPGQSFSECRQVLGPSAGCRAAMTDLLLSLMTNMNANKHPQEEPRMSQAVVGAVARRTPNSHTIEDMPPPCRAHFDAVQISAPKSPYVATCSTLDTLPASDLSGSWSSEQSELDASEFDMGGTTLMVRNIPSAYTQESLLREWPVDGTWDLLYVPWNAKEGCNHGYAFVNFRSSAMAAAFRAKWQDQFLARFPAEESLDIKPADIQGWEANIAQLKKKRVHRIKIRQCQPVIIRDGRRVELKGL